ncbi:hypothetical protein CK203_112500 [Vitis vinifera]|uniref:Integrase catalytic domain-containing protein n=1 Tax=Vitis vinifera TaxID=29760 RepID=A0A438CPN9_VITVI|nr:hypothetical protein CK203_112500 [Vitis vinifera]
MFLVKTPWYAHIANYLVTGEIPNQIIRKCVPEDEQQGIPSHCHENACGGHFASQKTAMKAIPCKQNDHRVVLKFLKENIFSRFGVPKAIISDGEAEYGLDQGGEKRFLDLNEMEELRNNAYINSKVAKQRMKKWHDQLISNKEFQEGQRVLMYDTRLHIFPGKLKSRWIGPFIIHRVYSNGVVELLNSNGKDSFKSMDIVSSHSWSHSNQKRRRSTSLSLKKPKEKGFAGREVSARYFACEVIWHRVPCEEHIWLRNHCEWKADFAPKVHSAGYSQRVLAHECTRNIHFAAAKRTAKAPFSQPFVFFSEPRRPASGHLLRSATSAKVRYPKWHEHEGLSLHLLRTAKESAKGAKSRFCSRAFAVKPNPPPVKPRHQSRRQDDTLPEPSPIPSPVQTPVPSPVPSPVPASSIAGTISGAARKISGASSATSEPQIHRNTLEEVIGGQCYLSPQLRETWIVELGIPFRALLRLSSIQSEAGACPIIPAAEEVSYGALLAPRDFFYPRIATDFYQSMTTKEHWTQRRGVSWKLFTRCQKDFLWASSSDHGSPSLFEEKVHKRSFREQIAFPPLPKAAMPNFGASGIPSEPQLERKRICLAAPAIPRAPPAAPASSQPSTSAEPRMAIPISEYRELCRALETLTASQSNLAQEMAAIRACQEQMLASQAQQAAILRQLQVHFDLPQAVEPSTDTPPEPHSHLQSLILQSPSPS